jgi:hypothetical protein
MDAHHFDDEFEEAVAEWRSRHRLAEDDAVLLLIELFRLHQRHWDEIRRRELPSFEQFRSDIAKLSDGFERTTPAECGHLANRIQDCHDGRQGRRALIERHPRTGRSWMQQRLPARLVMGLRAWAALAIPMQALRTPLGQATRRAVEQSGRSSRWPMVIE